MIFKDTPKEKVRYLCFNHDPIIVLISKIALHLFDNNYYLSIDSDFKTMQISKITGCNDTEHYFHTDDLIDEIPFDKKLTPENFTEKVKTYLTFQ